MAKFATKLAALALSGAVAVTAFAPAAQADHRWRHRHDRDVGAAIALGAGALALGAIIANSNNDRQRVIYRDDDGYRDYRPRRVHRVHRVYEEPRVRYRDYGGLEPWTDAWYDYCSDRYRSFNPRTGTFIGYDGGEHFCVAN